jgi:uncharacterized protein involved in type VI secretion and phage assembly
MEDDEQPVRRIYLSSAASEIVQRIVRDEKVYDFEREMLRSEVNTQLENDQ